MHLVYYFAALVVLPALSSSVDDGLRALLFGGVRAGKPEHTKLCVATLNYFLHSSSFRQRLAMEL